jgi:hypothetical protein
MKLTAHTTPITAHQPSLEPYVQVLEANKSPYYNWQYANIKDVPNYNPRSQIYRQIAKQYPKILRIESEAVTLSGKIGAYLWLLPDGRMWEEGRETVLGDYCGAGNSLEDAATITPENLNHYLKMYNQNLHFDHGKH